MIIFNQDFLFLPIGKQFEGTEQQYMMVATSGQVFADTKYTENQILVSYKDLRSAISFSQFAEMYYGRKQ